MNNVLDTQNEDQKPVYDDIDSASDALLARWQDAEQLSENPEEEATAQVEEETEAPEQEEEILDEVEMDDDEDGIDPEDEEEAEDAEEDEVIELNDDTLIDILVDGETQQASIKDLKRLYGQEASLTRKSQETAKQRKEAEEQLGKTSAIFQKMLEKAEARWKPYEEVDMLVASRTMDTDDFAQLRREAQEAHDDLKFFQEEADGFFKEIQEQQQLQLQEAAREAVKVLEADIPDWNTDLYNDIRSYAIAQGLPEEQVNQYVDPNVIKILNKARLFDQAKQVTTTKKKRTAKKVLKSNKAPQNDAARKAKRLADARAKLRSRGNDIDDVAELLMERWRV